jgi:hypothetical protein
VDHDPPRLSRGSLAVVVAVTADAVAAGVAIHDDKNRSARLRLRCVYVAAQIRATERAARLREAELVVERTLTARRVQALQRGRRQRRRYLTQRRAALDIQRAARGRAARGVAASVRREHAAARRMQVTEIPLRFYAVCSS